MWVHDANITLWVQHKKARYIDMDNVNTTPTVTDEEIEMETRDEMILEFIYKAMDNMKSIATIICKQTEDMHRDSEEYDISNAIIVLNENNLMLSNEIIKLVG